MYQHFQQIGGVIETPFLPIQLYVSRYLQGDGIAVEASTTEEPPEPALTLSTNLAPQGVRLDANEFCVKAWSENAPFIEPLLRCGLFEDTGRRVRCGFVNAPVWRIIDPMNVPPSHVIEAFVARDRALSMA